MSMTDAEVKALYDDLTRLQIKAREAAAFGRREAQHFERVLSESRERAEERRAVLRRAGVRLGCPRCGSF